MLSHGGLIGAAGSAVGSGNTLGYLGYSNAGGDVYYDVWTAVTVPVGCAYAIIAICGYTNPYRTISTLTLGGVSATPIYVATSNSAESYYIYGVVPPSVGSLTYHRAFNGDLTIGGSDTLIYLDGVPSLHDSDITIVGAATNSISWTLDSVNGGLGLAFANTWAGSGGAPVMTAQSQTLIANITSNSYYFGSGRKAASGSTITLGATTASAQTNWSGVGISLSPPA